MGLEKMGRLCCKDCVQIVDLYHAMEHAGQVLEAWLGKGHPDYQKQLRRWAKRLLKDKVQALIQETRQQCAGTPQAAAVEQALGCFVRNVSRMQYGTFRAAGWFIGSGVVEAGCKTVIGGAVQTIRQVLVEVRRRKHPRAALPSEQPEAGRLLEIQTQPTRRSQ